MARFLAVAGVFLSTYLFAATTNPVNGRLFDHNNYDRVRGLLNAYIPTLDDSVVSYNLDRDSQGLDPASIKVLVWNVLKTKKAGFRRDFYELQRDKDLILIQEYYQKNSDLPRFITDYFHTVIGASFGFKNKRKNGHVTGVATLSKEKSQKNILLRTRKREPIIGTSKVSLITFYDIQNFAEKLMVINIHAINFVATKHFKRQIESIITQIEQHQGPILFGGDFNTWNSSRFDFLRARMKGLNFTHVLYQKDSLKKFLGHPLDHLFFRGLELKSARAYDDIKGSDHKPLEAEFTLNFSEFN